MITITPQGQIYLCKTPLENDYKNQLTFANKSAQATYFNTTIQQTFDNYTYIKKDNVVKVGINIDKIIDCNYLFYANVGFTEDDNSLRTYYCFITNMEYINENCTAITFETDCYQTWMFDLVYKRCFVEREHVSNDTIGLHTLPENVETGEYIQQKVTTTESDSFNFFEDGSNHAPLIVVGVADTGLNSAVPSGSRVYSGIYSGLYYLTFPTTADADDYIRYVQTQFSSDPISTVFMLPFKLATSGSSFTWLTFQQGTWNFQYAFIDYSNSSTYMQSGSINKPSVLDANYIPKNKKLLTYPYCYLTLSNNSGSAYNYRYEDFTEVNGSSISTCSFQIYGAVSVGGSIKAYPIHYKKGKTALNFSEENYIEGLDAGKMPTCGWINDAYTNWLTSNALNIGLDLAGDVINIGSGNVVGGTMGIASSVAQVYEHTKIPTTAKGGTNEGDLVYAKGITFTPYKMSIKEEYAKVIDEYFSMFGYKVNSVKIPNITGRTNWNYVKTIDCNFEGNIPQQDLNVIKTMFNNGVTLWHNSATMYDYSQSNAIS